MLKESHFAKKLSLEAKTTDYFWRKAKKELTEALRCHFEETLETQLPTVLEYLKLGKVVLVKWGERPFFLEWNERRREIELKNKIPLGQRSVEVEFFDQVVEEVLSSCSELKEAVEVSKFVVNQLLSHLKTLEESLSPMRKRVEQELSRSGLVSSRNSNWTLKLKEEW